MTTKENSFIVMRSKILFAIIALFSFIKGFSQQSNDGWVNLFNGKDLSGFKQLNGKAIYEVKNGEIIGTNVDKEPNSFLATEKNYRDFILELELLVDTAMNSGIQFRSQSISSFKEGRVHGYQMEVDPSERAWSGAIFDEGRRGWLYTLDLNPTAKTAFKNNQWNKYRIECFGNTIRTWVNGVATGHLIDDMTPEGFIALQVHAVRKGQTAGKQIRWRNIRIKTGNIKPSPYDNIFVVNLIPNNLSGQEKKIGFKMLWDGKTNKEWQGSTTKSFPIDRWKIQDGVLTTVKTGNAASVNDIVTDEEFSAFELKFDFKLSEGANGGVQYFVTKDGDKIIHGLAYQLVDDSKDVPAKDNHYKLASLSDLMSSTITDDRFIRKIGDWNEAVIKAQPNNKIGYWLNGMKVLEFAKGSKEFSTLIAQNSQNQSSNKIGVLSGGRILLENHGSEISFRSIKIRRLK